MASSSRPSSTTEDAPLCHLCDKGAQHGRCHISAISTGLYTSLTGPPFHLRRSAIKREIHGSSLLYDLSVSPRAQRPGCPPPLGPVWFSGYAKIQPSSHKTHRRHRADQQRHTKFVCLGRQNLSATAVIAAQRGSRPVYPCIPPQKGIPACGWEPDECVFARNDATARANR
jgi:hypothetical protein